VAFPDAILGGEHGDKGEFGLLDSGGVIEVNGFGGFIVRCADQ